MTDTPNAWQHNLSATQTIRRKALDADDRRELLEMCGLVEPGSRVLVPDDTRHYDLARIEARQETHEPNLNRREKGCASPPGLANLAPVAQQPKPKPRPKPVERKPTQRRKAAQCGTPSGYEKHIRKRTEICQPCREARNAYARARAAEKRGRPGRQPAECGTKAGADRHVRLKEPVCDPCRLARNAYNRELYERRKAS